MFGQEVDKKIVHNPEWREAIAATLRAHKFDEDAMGRFLAVYARTGRKQHSAQAAGVCVQTVNNHIKEDKNFALATAEAIDHFRDKIMEAVYEQAVTGILEPIFGGKFKDVQVGAKRVLAPNLLALEAKRVNPAYRDKTTVDMNVTGGVLLVPAAMTPDEWEKKFGRKDNDGPDPGRSLEAPTGESDDIS